MEITQEQYDELWMAAQEIHTFVAGVNHAWTERLIDRAVPEFIFREHMARYRSVVADTAGKDVLDMACGTGYGSDFLNRETKPRSITGVDIEPDAIRYAKLRYAKYGIDYIVADACTAWTDRQFDTIVSFETIEHVPRPDQFLINVHRMLRPDGTLHVSSPIRKSGVLSDHPLNPFHIREWTIDEFRSLLGLFFVEVEIFGQTFSLKKKVGPIRIPGRMIARMQKPYPLKSPFFEALIYDVLPFDIVPEKYQATTPVTMAARCRKPKKSVDPAAALLKAMG